MMSAVELHVDLGVGKGEFRNWPGDAPPTSLAEPLAEVASLWATSNVYPFAGRGEFRCPLREASGDLLKLDLNSTQILCGGRFDSVPARNRILGAIARSRAIQAQLRGNSSFAAVPIVKAGFSGVIYYVEAMDLPEMVLPTLVEHALELYLALLTAKERLLEMEPNAYLDLLARGEDPRGLLAADPHLYSLLIGLKEQSQPLFIAEIGAYLLTKLRKVPPQPRFWNRLFGRRQI